MKKRKESEEEDYPALEPQEEGEEDKHESKNDQDDAIEDTNPLEAVNEEGSQNKDNGE